MNTNLCCFDASVPSSADSDDIGESNPPLSLRVTRTAAAAGQRVGFICGSKVRSSATLLMAN